SGAARLFVDRQRRRGLRAGLYADVGNAEGRRPPRQLLAARHDLPQSRQWGVEDRPYALVGAVLHGRQPAPGVRSAALKTASGCSRTSIHPALAVTKEKQTCAS